MIRKYLAIALSLGVLAFLAVQLDYLLAGSIRPTEAATAAARAFSLAGNGAFLFGVAALLFIAGYGTGRSSLKAVGAQGFASLIASGVAVHVLKAAFERPRIAHSQDAILTFLYDPSLADLTGRFNSFPSGHTTSAFALAAVLSRAYPSLALPFYGIAALIGASRVYLGSHYPTDVLAGAIVGVVSGYLVMAKTGRKEKWIAAVLGLLVVSMSFFKSGGFLLFDVDEAVFSEAAREMAATGDYITPTYNLEPRYDKPILIYWFMSAAFKLFGVTEFGARFTSGLFGTLLCAATFLFVNRVKGFTAAACAAVALLLNLEFFVYSHSAVTDMTLAFFITSSLFAFFLWVREGHGRWLALFWAAAALAVMTKGVIGILFPAVISAAFLFLSGRLKVLKDLWRPRYLGLFLIIAAPWFVAEYAVNGWEFFEAFIIKHHIKRYSGVISSHSGPFYYYLGVMLLGFFPWVALLPYALARAWKERLEEEGSLYLLAGVWFAFVFVFFSISRTKLPNYIFPLFPAAAILAGLALSEIIEDRRRRGRMGLYMMAALSAVFAAALFALPSFEVRMDVAMPAGFFYTLGALFGAVALLSLSAFIRPAWALAAMAATMAVMIGYLRIEALPPVNIYLQKTMYDYARYAREHLPEGGSLATYEINKPSVSFYARRKVDKTDRTDTCVIKERSKSALVVITTAGRAAELDAYGLKLLDSRDGYVLLATADMPPFRPYKPSGP